MKSKYAPSIRSRLMLQVSACIIPAFLLAGILISYDYKLTRKNFIGSAMAIASANAMEVDKEFATVESALSALSTSPSFVIMDLAALHAQATNLLLKQNIFNIVLEDDRGQQLMNTIISYGQAMPLEADDFALKTIRKSRTTYISNLFTGTLTKRQLVSVGIPLINGVGKENVLTGTVSAVRFGDILQNQKYPEYWIASILDRNGKIVARSIEMQNFVGASAMPEVLSRIRMKTEDAFEINTVDGKSILVVFAKAQKSGWTVAIGIPIHVLSNNARDKVLMLVLVTVISLGTGLIFAWRIGGQIRRAMQKLIPPALALGTGNEVESANYGLREADEVGQALMKASRMLRSATYQANHDALTGIANRIMLRSFLEHHLALCCRMNTELSVLYLDLDGFKLVNDKHGHAAGDALLRQAADRLVSRLRKSDIAARMGGDEFAVVLVNITSNETTSLISMIETVMEQPYEIDGLSLIASASVGFATYPHCGSTADELLAAADHSMYLRKSYRKKFKG